LDDFTAWPKISVMDMEARTREGESFGLDIVCVCHVDEFGQRKAFRTALEYLVWVYSDACKSEIVWSHWGGRYDHRFIAWEASKLGWSWKAIISGNLIIILVVTNSNGRVIRFCDSSRLMPDSVASIGRSLDPDDNLGLRKLKEDRTAIGNLSWEQVQTYCYRDCDIIVAALKRMRKTLLGIGCDFAFTLASIATRYVRRSGVLDIWKFYERDPVTRKMQYSADMKLADKFAYPAFAGGRVEVFRIGIFEGPLYYYDITSSYPRSMQMELPSYHLGFQPPLKSIEKSLTRCGISEATVFIPQRAFYANILPVKDKGKLTFPWGHFRGRWTNVELLELWERGYNKGVRIELHGQSIYKPMEWLRPFVDTFSDLRRQAIESGDIFQSYVYKIFQNALYGKLTESAYKRSVLFGDDEVDDALARYGDYVITNDFEVLTRHIATEEGIASEAMIEGTETPGVYILKTIAEGPFKHHAAGAYVTALSRLRLLQGIEKCRAAGAIVYYSDTDSIITNKPVFPEMKKRLGEWHLEAVLSRAEIYSSKVYKIVKTDGSVIYKAKGMPITRHEMEPNEPHVDCLDCEQRWIDFTGGLRGEVHDKPSKAGIRGFLTDISHGSVEPKSFSLRRQMLNGDLKRTHLANGDSEAIWYSNLVKM